MNAPARFALALWAILALAVYAATFDWQTRMAGFDFIRAQTQLRAQGAPLDTIEQAFRPLVRRAAMRSLLWPGVILAAGGGAVVLAARREPRDAF